MRGVRSRTLRALSRRPLAFAAATLAVLCVAPGGALAAERATIRWTAHGIPHVLADDFRGLGYGYGHAVASMNLCALADAYVTVRAERSRFFGPEASWTLHANQTTQNNLDSDFFFQRIIDARTVEKLIARRPPHGPLPAVRSLVRGYVAGYNELLRRTGVDAITDPACRGKPWVRPITAMDVYRRFHQLGMLVSGALAIEGIGGAQPPPPGATPVAPAAAEVTTLLDRLAGGVAVGIGSNAYALGGEATRSGAAMVLGNPHFPWDGAERFFQAQLTIPGRYNVSGATLLGVPLVLVGHTDGLAWSHTTTPAWHFTPFEERLVPGQPTTYLYDGRPTRMRRDHVTVQVRTADGALEPRTRTLYSTHHGPVLTSIDGTPLFPWTHDRAFALGDANAQHMRFLNHFFAVGRSRSTTELLAVMRRYQGVPWVHTLAADARGRALYADMTVVPHVTDAKASECNTALGAAAFERLRLPVLDGSRSACEWGRDPDALQPGTFGPSSLPTVRRRDYVVNSNDDYWLPNPRSPLEGFPRILGAERTERSLRTRLAIVMAEQRLAGTDGLAGRRFTLAQLRRVALNNRNHGGELTRAALVAFCEQHPIVVTREGPVDIREACPVLAAWDIRVELASRGAILFRLFAERLLADPTGVPGANAVGGGGTPPDVWRRPFDPDDPVHTPRELNTANPRMADALGLAVKELRDAGIALDAPLGKHQREPRGAERIPIHGNPGELGVFNQIEAPFAGASGFPDVVHGTSFLMAAHLRGRCPKVRTILSYSQSSDPTSAFFADQTRLFSGKRWLRGRFCEREIRRAPGLRVQHLSGGARRLPQRERRPSFTG